MANPYGIKTLINRTFAGRFFIAKLSHVPIIGKILDDLLFAEDDITDEAFLEKAVHRLTSAVDFS